MTLTKFLAIYLGIGLVTLGAMYSTLPRENQISYGSAAMIVAAGPATSVLAVASKMTNIQACLLNCGN